MKDLLRRLKDENTLLLVQLGEKDEEITGYKKRKQMMPIWKISLKKPEGRKRS